MRSSFEPLNRVLESQAACRWEKFFEGNPVKGWARLQHDHFQEMGSMKTGEQWLHALIQKMWDTAWDQWDHQNGYVHKKELTAQDKELNSEIMEELRVGSAGLYGQVLYQFWKGQDRILKLSFDERTTWLKMVRLQRAEKLVNTARNYQQERRTIHHWLHQES